MLVHGNTISNAFVLNGTDGKDFRYESVKLIETSPGSGGGKSLENISK